MKHTVFVWIISVLMLVNPLSSQGQDSLKFKWGLELGAGPVGFGLRGQVQFNNAHRILIGMAYSPRFYYDFYPIRFGYQYAFAIVDKKHRWIYAIETTYRIKNHLSPSRLIEDGNGDLALTDEFYSYSEIGVFLGFGIQFNLLKYFKATAYPLVGYEFERRSREYSNPEIESVYSKGDGVRAGIEVGLVYEFSPKKGGGKEELE